MPGFYPPAPGFTAPLTASVVKGDGAGNLLPASPTDIAASRAATQKLQKLTGASAGNKTLALFHFDEGTGATAADTSGNSLVATLAGSATWGTEVTTVDYGAGTPFTGSSLRLNGTSAYAAVPTLLDAAPAAITIACYFRPGASGVDTAQRYLFFKGWDGSHKLEIYTAVGKLFIKVGNGNFQVFANLSWTAGVSYGLAFVLGVGRMAIYRADPATRSVTRLVDSWTDANAQGTAAFSNYPPPVSFAYFNGASPQPFCIGASNVGGTAANFSDGFIDEVVVEDHPWTQEEFERRMVQWKPYTEPVAERARWVQKLDASFTATQAWEYAGGTSPYGVGEITLIPDPVTTGTVHMVYTAGYTTPSVGYAVSTNGGSAWTKPLSNPIVGNGQGGVTAGQRATHASAIYSPVDGYVYITFSQNSANIYIVKSNRTTVGGTYNLGQVFQGGFTGGTGTVIINQSKFSSAGPHGTITYLGNSSIAYLNGFYYIAVEVGYNGYYQVCFARSTTPDGTYTALNAGAMPASLLPASTTDTQMTAPQLTTELVGGYIHMYCQYQNDPCEVWHWVTRDCQTWQTPDLTNNNPALPMLLTAASTAAGVYADQDGDPCGVDLVNADGSKTALMALAYVNNQTTPATSVVKFYNLAGGLGTTVTAPSGASIPAILSSTNGINAKTSGATALYTVPAGKTCVIIGSPVICSSVTGTGNGPTLSVGYIASSYADIFPSTALTGLNTASGIGSLYWFPATGIATVVPSGGVIYVNNTSPSTLTTQILTIHLSGYLY